MEHNRQGRNLEHCSPVQQIQGLQVCTILLGKAALGVQQKQQNDTIKRKQKQQNDTIKRNRAG